MGWFSIVLIVAIFTLLALVGVGGALLIHSAHRGRVFVVLVEPWRKSLRAIIPDEQLHRTDLVLAWLIGGALIGFSIIMMILFGALWITWAQ